MVRQSSPQFLDFGLKRRERRMKALSDNRKSLIQNPKWVALFATVVALTLSAAKGEAQQPTKLPKIGYLSGVSPAAETARREAFNRGLRQLGYVEGKTILIEYRYSEGRYARLAGLATELLRLKPD